MSSLAVDLHRLSKVTNFALPVLCILFFLAGHYLSFYFHFLTVACLFLTIANFFYLKVQTGHSLLRNFGLLAQGRYLLESIGPELRQYMFSSDTEERPFNRVERSEIYRKAKNIDSASSFGSLKDFDSAEITIRHSLYPVDHEDLEPYRLTLGEERGIDSAYLDDGKLKELAAREPIKMIEIKFSQGAKPGKGGLLPKEKITREISELRGVPLGKDVVSPPHCLECTDKATTVAFIRRVQEVSGLPVGIKSCVGSTEEVEALIQEMVDQKTYPDYISLAPLLDHQTRKLANA